MRVVSRITHERNLEAIHRAGANFVLSYATLGIDAVYAALRDRTLAGSGIGEQTGLNVVAIEHDDTFRTNLGGDTTLPSDGHLVLIGSDQQMESFVDRYE
jgi:K+/H+ antiporter YhaU regulatory subunit KhtT